MCRERRGLVAVAAAFGLLQSVLWVGATLVVLFIYYCVIPPVQYEDGTDFFKVTLVKLYFEGPRCIPDGSYLGKFNDDYKDSINLLGRHLFIFVALANIIINILYFFLSIGLYWSRQKQMKRFFFISWSVVTLVLCALDALLTYCLVLDAFTLMLYLTDNGPQPELNLLGGIPYIPLLLSFISSRFIVVWMWNLFIGIYLLFVGLCGMGASKKQDDAVVDTPPAEKVEEEKAKEEPAEQSETKPPPEDAYVSLIRGNFTSAFDLKSYPDYTEYERTMSAITRYPAFEEDARHRAWCYRPPSEIMTHPKSNSNKEWEATNEGYVDDEQVSGGLDFDHDLRNFEAGEGKIRVSKPPVGKPVSIPVPPPLPSLGSCNC